MKATAHARLTTAVAVAVAGMAGGHLLMPHAPGASPARGASFYALMLAVGAWRGWREARVRAEWAAPPGPPVGPPVGGSVGAPVGAPATGPLGGPRGPLVAACADALGAALLAAAGYWVAHGV